MKIFKLFVCISLILSISLVNSFAAISVSDGSAFVTKAEFAADLNNLSNRMSSLENSLDEKIDSLVSSYISRNDIWNGEKQNVSNTKDWSFRPKSIAITNSRASFSGELINEVIIEKTSKSGLLTGFLFYVDADDGNLNSNNSRWGYSIFTENSARHFSDSGMCFTVGLTETIEGETIPISKSTSVIGSAMVSFRNYSSETATTMVISLPSAEVLFPQTFFVSKASKISISIRLDVNLTNVTSVSLSGHSVKVEFKDEFQIY